MKYQTLDNWNEIFWLRNKVFNKSTDSWHLQLISLIESDLNCLVWRKESKRSIWKLLHSLLPIYVFGRKLTPYTQPHSSSDNWAQKVSKMYLNNNEAKAKEGVKKNGTLSPIRIRGKSPELYVWIQKCGSWRRGTGHRTIPFPTPPETKPFLTKSKAISWSVFTQWTKMGKKKN